LCITNFPTSTKTNQIATQTQLTSIIPEPLLVLIQQLVERLGVDLGAVLGMLGGVAELGEGFLKNKPQIEYRRRNDTITHKNQ
jgi:hypothetical protein